MIWVTRLNGTRFVVNCDLIKTAESTPDTVITLTTGEKLMIKEDVQSLIDQTIRYRQVIAHMPPSFQSPAEVPLAENSAESPQKNPGKSELKK